MRNVPRDPPCMAPSTASTSNEMFSLSSSLISSPYTIRNIEDEKNLYKISAYDYRCGTNNEGHTVAHDLVRHLAP